MHKKLKRSVTAMPNNYRPEANVQLIPYYEYDPSIHDIEYRYLPNTNTATSGETYTTFNPTFGATDYRFFPAPFPRPFYPYPRPPFYGGYHPYGGYHGYPYGGGYGGGYHGYPHGGYGGYHHGSSSR
jgi:hypothetical protein